MAVLVTKIKRVIYQGLTGSSAAHGVLPMKARGE